MAGAVEIPAACSDEARKIIPPVMCEYKWARYHGRYLRVKANARICDPPAVAPDVDEAALRALGVLDFAQLSLPSSGNQAKDLIIEFIAFFTHAYDDTCVRHRRIWITKKTFREALKLPSKVPAESPPDVDPTALRTAVLRLMEAYILPRYKSERLPAAGEEGVERC